MMTLSRLENSTQGSWDLNRLTFQWCPMLILKVSHDFRMLMMVLGQKNFPILGCSSLMGKSPSDIPCCTDGRIDTFLRVLLGSFNMFYVHPEI